MLDFRIETFLAVCQTMNFTKAAELLHITQPAVSNHIHALERQYGVKLFQYEGKQLSLTGPGRLFWQTAATMHHDARHLCDNLRELDGRRHLCFGATLTIGEYSMPGSLLRLLEFESDAGVQMLVANTAELLRLLDQGGIDFAIVEGFFPKRAYDSLPYSTERYVPVCAPGYRFASDALRLEDLLEERLFIREPGSGTREVLERVLEERNLTVGDFRQTVELGSLDAIKTMVCAGAGISFFFQPAVQAELQMGRLREIPLNDFAVTHDFAFLWRKGSVFAPYYKETFALLKDGKLSMPDISR